MRWRLWAAAGGGTLLSLLAILVILDSPRGLEAEPSDGSITAAQVGQPYTLGVENSSFSVQNAGLFPASVVVDYYDPDGVRVAQDRVDGLRSGASVVFDQASQPDLPHGFTGSAVVTADQAIKTIILKYIEREGVLSLGADDALATGFNRVYLPVIYSRFGPDGAWNTRFALQNVSAATSVCVQMTYRGPDGTVVFSEPPVDAVPDPQCLGGGLPLAAGSVILRNQANMTEELPEQFEGSLIIETVGEDTELPPSELLAVSADVFNSQRPDFASYHGLGWNPSGTGDLSTVVLVPLVFKNYGEGNGWNTRFAITSADPAQTTEATVTYCCDERLPGPNGSLRQTSTVQASATIDQALEDELPDGFAGSAIITSDQPVAVVATMASASPDKPSFGTFVAIPQATASTTVWLPVVYKDAGWKGPAGDAAGWNSWFRVQVADGGTANLQITYHGDKLEGGSVSFSDTVTNSKTFDQHTDPLLPVDFEGAAVITSDQPIAVVAGITSDAYQGDANALFAGLGPELFPGTPPPDVTPPVQLARGWNSVCYRQSQQPVESALASVLNSVVAVYRLRPDQVFDRWFAGEPDLSTITALSPYDSLFILTGSDASWEQQAFATPHTGVNLGPGWNSVCYAGPTQDTETAIATISSQVGVIYALAADQGWSQFTPNRPEISTLTQLEQFDCVLVLITDIGGTTWTFSP